MQMIFMNYFLKCNFHSGCALQSEPLKHALTISSMIKNSNVTFLENVLLPTFKSNHATEDSPPISLLLVEGLDVLLLWQIIHKM